jgi:hypothetical protein
MPISLPPRKSVWLGIVGNEVTGGNGRSGRATGCNVLRTVSMGLDLFTVLCPLFAPGLHELAGRRRETVYRFLDTRYQV